MSRDVGFARTDSGCKSYLELVKLQRLGCPAQEYLSGDNAIQQMIWLIGLRSGIKVISTGAPTWRYGKAMDESRSEVLRRTHGFV